MKSAIEQMCYGLRGTYESVKVTKRYTSIMGKVCDADEALTKLLKAGSEEDRLYRQFKEHIDEAACEECESYYKEGFRFGVLLGLDIAEEQ